VRPSSQRVGPLTEPSPNTNCEFDIPHRVRAVYGRQLGIAGANGGYSYVALFYRNNRLYQVEGDALVAGGRRKLTRCASSSRSISRSARWIVAHHPQGRRNVCTWWKRTAGMKGACRF
jgi:hypothetical protein